MSSAQAPRSRRSTLISHPTLLGERWMPSPRWEHLQGHCLAETLSFVNPALTTGRYYHCGRPRQAARATYRLRAHALLRRDGPCARWIIGPGKGLRGLVEETSVLRASVSSTTLTVSSIEELNTRSMSLHTRPCDLLVTDDSHMSDAISSRALSTSRHFWPCTQMGLRSGVRARFDTVSSTEHRSPNAGRVGT